LVKDFAFEGVKFLRRQVLRRKSFRIGLEFWRLVKRTFLFGEFNKSSLKRIEGLGVLMVFPHLFFRKAFWDLINMDSLKKGFPPFLP